jgi:hypothetical protein
MRDEGGAVADIAEPPDRAGVALFDVGLAEPGRRIGEIADRVKTVDGEARGRIGDDPLGRCAQTGLRYSYTGSADAEGQHQHHGAQPNLSKSPSNGHSRHQTGPDSP